ncbi:MAG: flavodoxin family protein [Oscillospiraceae bacterium]|nr:flavodoxin family protein [Oscillospiraceae bacterium]
MSKVLLINGSPHKNGCTNTALEEIAKTLKACEVDSEILWLGCAPIADCVGCFSCKQTGKCFVDDYVNAIAARLDEFDGLIVGSPVYYAGPTGAVCAFLDRLFFSVDKKKFNGKPAAAVVSCRRGGASAAFDRLNKYFSISNMNVVGSQYWNQVHGSKPEDVLQDEEGLQTMRTLARNMAYLIHTKGAADAAKLRAPVYERPRMTNFIR